MRFTNLTFVFFAIGVLAAPLVDQGVENEFNLPAVKRSVKIGSSDSSSAFESPLDKRVFSEVAPQAATKPKWKIQEQIAQESRTQEDREKAKKVGQAAKAAAQQPENAQEEEAWWKGVNGQEES